MTKILVIEDNTAVREEVADILSFEGFEVKQAANGRIGLERIRESVPDLVLCDLMMPEMDGYETLQTIRGTPAFSTLPFLCLTARVERHDLRRAMESGADDYITKPFAATELLAAISATLEKDARKDQVRKAKAQELRERLVAALPETLDLPLRTIIDAAEELMSNSACRESPEKASELGGRVLVAARRLNRIAANFLLFTQLEVLDPAASGAEIEHEIARLKMANGGPSNYVTGDAPRNRSDPPSAGAEAPPGSGHLPIRRHHSAQTEHKKRLLLIENNKAVREEVAAILTLEGFEVRQAPNGRIGLDLVRQAAPDLLICDLMMPETDGYEVLRAVRADPQSAGVPFLCLTGRTEREALRRAMEFGADDYVTKPFTAAELLAAISAAFEKRRATDKFAEMQADDLRMRLISTLPHELRTPLHSIMGYADIVIDTASCADTQAIAEMAHRIYACGLRFQHLLENVVLYGRLTALERGAFDRHDVEGPPVAADAVTARAAHRVAGDRERERDLILNLGPACVELQEDYLAKLIEELMDNAFKFSRPGTPVGVTTFANPPYVCIRVEDQGRGMSAQQIAKIDAFAQFERIIYEQQGLGLGLAIAQRIASLAGGTLEIESVPGQRTALTVSLPVCGRSTEAAG